MMHDKSGMFSLSLWNIFFFLFILFLRFPKKTRQESIHDDGEKNERFSFREHHAIMRTTKHFYDTTSNKYKSPNHSSMEHFFWIAFQIKQESFKCQVREDFQARMKTLMVVVEVCFTLWVMFYRTSDILTFLVLESSFKQPNLFLSRMSARPIEVAIHRRWKLTGPMNL